MRVLNNILTVMIFALTGTALVSCNKSDYVRHRGEGFVYTMSNDTARNSILVYMQDAKGKLSYAATVNSGGKGLGRGLGSQGPLIIDKSKMMLFAVNAGDNSISSFKISSNGSLTLLHTINSGGITPVSLAVNRSLLYVVNNGGNISGFRIGANGELTGIPGSAQPLSRGDAGPGEILFQPDGSHVVVSEKNTHRICTIKKLAVP